MRTFIRYSQGDLQGSALQSVLVIKAVIAIMIVSCVGFFGCASLQAQKLAFDPKGDLLALSGYEIFKYTADGTKTTFATLSKRPISLAFDSAGSLFVGDFGGSIFRFAPEGTKSTFATGLTEAGELACDTAGDLFVGDGVDFLILKFTPNKRKTTVATNVQPEKMVFDPSGNLLVPTHGSQSILKITPAGAKSTFATEIAYPSAPAVDPSGNLFVSDSGAILKITPEGRKSVFVKNLDIDIFNAICDRHGNLFVAYRSGDSILKFTPDGKQSTFGSVGTPDEMVFDKAGNLFVLNDFAIYRFDPDGNRMTFSSDRLSPDKHWEYQCSDSGKGAGIAKTGANQVVLDLSSDLDSRFASDAKVVWAPDSKRFAINYRSGSHSASTDVYQLNGDQWVALRSPEDAMLEILQRAKSAEKAKKSRSEETSESPDFDSWTVERWTAADTAVLYAHLMGSDYLFVFTLKFDEKGNWKIVRQHKESVEQ